MKKKIFLSATIAFLLFNPNVQAKNITLDELQSSQANFKPAVNITAKEVNSGHWAYKSLENITRKYGLLVGDAGEKFDGSKPLTRNEAAVILVNLIGKVEQEKINIDQSEKVQIDILKNELSEEITALTGRVAVLENSVGKLQGSVSNIEKSSGKTLKYSFGEDFKINGGMQLRYNGIAQKGADSGNFAPNFSIPLSDIRFSGKIAKHINYMVEPIYNRTWGGSASTTTAGGLLGDAYVSTDILPHHTIFVGQTRAPIGVEGTTSPFALNTIDRSQIARNFSDYRDMGIKVAGTFPIVDYYLGAYNGAGQNYKDYSSNMGFGGWVTAKPLYKLPEYGKLEIGGGAYRQNNGNTTNTALSTRYETQTYGAAIGYKYKKFGIKNEYAFRRGYGATASNGTIPVAKGMFVETTYDLTPKMQLLAKYDVFNPSNKQNTNTEYTLGTNYFFAGNNIKLQVDGVAVSNQQGKDSKRLMVLTQYMF
ncbi:MAG: hypothetical protein A2104_01195 [Candidatus Melainabacteria bacterium GWF2_32_7]|nr:MAG: hypothetical protein A2104_01195 [Candidatus Melainabacteria bacterium GWF2_32_7]